MPERSGIRSNISGQQRVATDLPDQDNSNMTLDLTKMEMKAKVTADLIYPEKIWATLQSKVRLKITRITRAREQGNTGKYNQDECPNQFHLLSVM